MTYDVYLSAIIWVKKTSCRMTGRIKFENMHNNAISFIWIPTHVCKSLKCLKGINITLSIVVPSSVVRQGKGG